MSDLNQEEDHESQPHHSDGSQQTNGRNQRQRRITYVRLLRGQPSHPENLQTNGPKKKRNRRKPAPLQISTHNLDPVLYPDQKLEEADLKDYKWPPKVNKLIHKLHKTCQSQAILINSLQDDKRKLFLEVNKNKQDLKNKRDFKELKTLLSRAYIDEPEGEDVSMTMPWRDARRIFQMLDDSGEEDTDIDEDSEAVESITGLLGGVTLHGPDTPALREIAANRRERKLRRRKAREEEANTGGPIGQTRRTNGAVPCKSGKRVSFATMQGR